MASNTATKTIPADQLITAEEIAKRLKITPTSVYRYAKQGLISYHQIGGCKRFTESDYADFLAKTRCG